MGIDKHQLISNTNQVTKIKHASRSITFVFISFVYSKHIVYTKAWIPVIALPKIKPRHRTPLR